MIEPGVDLRPVVVGRSSRGPVLGAAAVGLALVGLIVAGRVGPSGPAAQVRPNATPVAAAPSVASSVAPVSATPLPVPSRLVPFRIAGAGGTSVTYVSPNLGFSAAIPIDAVSGYWDEGGPASEAGGVLTFGVPAESAAVGNGAIQVVVGSERDPAPVRIPADGGPVTPLWAPNLVTLVQQYGLLLEGGFGRQSPLTLDGEQAHLFEGPRSAAIVVLAVHQGRIYVISSLTASPSRGASRHAFGAFLASFRFVSASATP